MLTNTSPCNVSWPGAIMAYPPCPEKRSMLAVANARIEERVAEINQQVGEDDHRRRDDGYRLDHGEIALDQRLQEVVAHAWQREDRLQHNRTADDHRQLQADDRSEEHT